MREYKIRLMLIIFAIALFNSIQSYIVVKENIKKSNENSKILEKTFHDAYVYSFKNGWYQAIATMLSHEERVDFERITQLFKKDSIEFNELIKTNSQETRIKK